MNKEEFEEFYANNGGFSIEEFHRLGLVGVPCDCGESICRGWQAKLLPRKLEARIEHE